MNWTAVSYGRKIITWRDVSGLRYTHFRSRNGGKCAEFVRVIFS
jgi:hypothetical protein